MSRIECAYCKKEFIKEQKYINAAIRKNRKNFCSRTCSTCYRNKNTDYSTINRNLPQNKKGYTQKKDTRFSWYINRARCRKKDGGLTVKILSEQWEKQKGLCAISSLKIYLHNESKNKLYLASLDRINSSLPYEEHNIQFVAYPLNLAKNTFTNVEFLDFIKSMKDA